MAFDAFERMVALRYLRARRAEGFVSIIAGFSLLGICLGVGTLIVVMAVMNGFQEELLNRILGLNGHIGVYGQSGPLRDFDAVAGRIRGVDGVVRVTPVVEGQVMAAHGNNAQGAVVRGMRPEDLASRPQLARGVVAGTLADFTGTDSVVIGQRLARRLGVKPGEGITLVSSQGTATAFGMVPRMKTYRVAATFELGMYEYDSRFIFMTLEAAQLFFRTGPGVTHLEVGLDHGGRAGMAQAEITAVAGPVQLYDWQMANSSFFSMIQVERNVMFLILTLIIVVAAFNIISGLIMLVQDKARDVAILRTMGATRAMVLRIFLLSGASVGIVGTLAGVVLGLLFALNIESIRRAIETLTGTELFAADVYFLTEMPAQVQTAEVVGVALMAVLLSFAATLYPAWRAARLDPVELLRHE